MTTDVARPLHRSSGDGWTLETYDSDGVTVYAMTGEFDFAVSAKLRQVIEENPPSSGLAVADMTGVRFCDSSCLQVLLRLAQRLGRSDGRFAIATSVHAVVRPVTLLRLEDLMPLHPTVEAARTALAARS
ncbi:STAS domain-containing protein [Amycolatopsis sp. NPDC089917]|uniref:STAS domain-containing protein n=1 Tax=Amycolatopsis sp. NPDC089917 TaxID=3155187 RepID=UPI003439CCB6